MQQARKEPKAAIAAELDRVREEIRAYPYPIPACDAQYNHLLERRRALVEKLRRMTERIPADD